MLPATGLFRSINCPFFEKDLCPRPYCHFRHIKPETPAAATYSATPKSLLNQANVPLVNSDAPAKKKPKLEYIPMPTILAPKYVPTVKVSSNEESKPNQTDEAKEKQALLSQTPAAEKNQIDPQNNTEPTHQKSTELVTPSNDHEENLANGHNETQTTKQSKKGSEKVSTSHTTNGSESKSKEPKASSEKKEVSTKNSEKKDASSKSSTKKEVSAKSSGKSTSVVAKTKSISEGSRHQKSGRDDHQKAKHNHEESNRKSSTSSSSNRKHSSSSSRDEKHRTKYDNKEKDHDKERSRSKQKDSSRDKAQKSDRDKERHKSSDKDRHRSSHSSSKSSSKPSGSGSSTKKSSSSSTSSRTHKLTSTKSSSVTPKPPKPKIELAEEIYRELLDNPPSDIDNDSDEDEVMKQCKMIFEEYDAEPTPTVAPPTTELKKPAPKPGTDVELIDMFAEKYYDENRRKRVAHDGSGSTKPTTSAPPPAKKPNHVQNAMKSVYLRQEIVRKQQEELTTRKRLEEEAKKRIEEETRKAMSKPVTPRLSNGSPRSPVLSPTAAATTTPPTDKSPVSPISTSSFYSKSPDSTPTTSRVSGRFTPAVNVLAFQKAKEKIEHLKKLKAINTPAQTAVKGSGRVAHSGPAIVTAPVPTAAPTKPAPPVLESDSTKISYNIRMQFYNLMIKHCLNIYSNCEDAWDRAQTEELAVFKKCNTPMIYKSSALLAINKLRKEAVDTGSEATDKNKTISHDVILAGKMGHNISWSVNKKIKSEAKSVYTIDNATSTDAYKMIYECILTDEQLQTNGFPRGTDIPGKAKIFTPKPSRPPNENERYCSRCSKVYNLETYDEPAVDSCNYHAKSTCYRRGFADNLHSCCQQPSGTAGCMYANYHVSSYMDYDDLTGFVKTIEPPEGYVPSKKDVFALDCEMCYTTGGLELTRVTVVDINEKTVYDTLVKPANAIVDYNTRFSGITEQMLKNTSTTLYNVQAVLLSMFNSETILIGHSLESDFKALKLIHDVVVDTSVLYPHKMGPPKKRALKTLCIENLKKIIQENDAGHDSAEDSVVCIQLIKHYLRNRIV